MQKAAGSPRAAGDRTGAPPPAPPPSESRQQVRRPRRRPPSGCVRRRPAGASPSSATTDDPMRMALSGSRTEFLAADTLGTAGDIQYGRSGGCFVSTRRGLLVAALVAAALVAVGLLVFYLAPCPNGPKATTGNATSDLSRGAPGEGAEGSSPPPDTGTPTSETTPSKVTPMDLRLPAAVRPRYYIISLQPFIGNEDTNNFTSKGLVDIEVFCEKAGEACSRISLHAKDLNVSSADVVLRRLPEGVSSAEARARRAVGKKYNATAENATAATTPAPLPDKIVKINNFAVAPEKDMITINLAEPMEVGQNYSLEIPFWGNVTTELSGLYRSSYTEKNGTKRWLAVTHFEPTSARKAFPCFDEPALKARFELHVARRDGSSSISNMPLERSEPIPDQPGWVWDHYPPSPVMSTYLLALVVSEMGRKSAPVSAPGAPAFDVAARPDLLHTANYSLDIGPRILDYYSEYFNVSYPLPKLTMAAVPDFAAGAMENWGLVLYRETLMLFDANTSTAQSQQSVAEVVAHELAHQWFGNLVTMAWWSDLWLNEGFATYVSYIGVNHVEPTWNMFDKIVTEEMHPVLETDSLNSSHPVSVEVQNPAQISESFDEVSYNKGACLIRMLNHSLTEPVFRSGLTSYLNKWKWANANQNDLWAALTEATGNGTGLLPPGVSVKQVMDTWTLQKGYPVLMATRDYTAGSVHLTQRQFKLEGTNGAVAEDDRALAWYVPVSYATAENVSRLQDTRPRAWLTPEHREGLTIPNVTTPGSNAWMLLNVQQTGYYRVNYDRANWRLLTELLHTAPLNSVPVASRAQLLGDVLNLARAGLVNYDTALNLTNYLVRETETEPWAAFLRAYSFLDDMLRDRKDYANLQAYLRRLLANLSRSLGRDARSGETQPERQLRASALSRLLRAEDPALLEWAGDHFARWSNAPPDANPIPVDLRYEVYCTAARFGGVREWTALEERFRASDQRPAERSDLLRALMCTRLPHLITTMLERSLEEGGDIRLQDSVYVWRSIASNPVASYIAFQYVREQWDSIYNRYSKVQFVLKEVLRSSIAGLSTELDLKDVLEFVQQHESQLTMAARTVQQALEKLRLRVHWRSRHGAQLAASLRQDAIAHGAAAAGQAAAPAASTASPLVAPTPAAAAAPSAPLAPGPANSSVRT